jgi:hypothetical protein
MIHLQPTKRTMNVIRHSIIVPALLSVLAACASLEAHHRPSGSISQAADFIGEARHAKTQEERMGFLLAAADRATVALENGNDPQARLAYNTACAQLAAALASSSAPALPTTISTPLGPECWLMIAHRPPDAGSPPTSHS